MLKFSVNQSTKDQIQEHLIKVDGDFTPPLHECIDIDAYSEKIANKALKIEVFDEHKLVALIAGYLNLKENLLFITNMSIEKSYRDTGLFYDMNDYLNGFLTEQYPGKIGYLQIQAEVRNSKLLPLYRKVGYFEFKTVNGSSFIEKLL
jgi:hypothetical protein